jgi:autotransporter-associated beta strand protein
MKMNNLIIRTLAALTLISVLSVPTGMLAATYFVDQNGPTAGLWDGVTTPIGADLTTTTNWTTTAAGTATTVAFSAANNIQIGNTVSDFNGATISITNNFNGNIGGNPASVFIVSTNVIVNWLGTSVNERFNHATTFTVTNGSTLSFSGNNYNWNNQFFTLTGNGTMNFNSVLGNNDSTSGSGGFIMNMIGGKVNLNQTAIGTFGNAVTGGAGFTLTNGTLNFVSIQSFADVFGDFQSPVSVKLNGGALDNLSGAAGTINVNLGSYSIGGNFAYLGTSQSMSLGSAAVLLTLTPQITVNANTLTIGGVINDGGNGYGLTKTGNGTLNLTGANTYTGPTTVNAGTLIVPTTSSGAGIFTNGDGATLAVKVTSIGSQLNMSGLTVGASTGGTLQFDVGQLGNPSVAPINVSGVLTVNGSANPISFSSISAITNYPVTMPLITYASASGSLSSFTLGSFPAASPAYSGYVSNDLASTTVYLVLTSGLVSAPPGAPKLVTWNGQTNGVKAANWDSVTTNWISSGVATNYAGLTTSGLGDPVTFDDTLTGTTNVNLTTTLSPVTVTVNNSVTNYVFSGNGRISGATSVTKSGTGTLVIDNTGNNDFSGGLTVNSGTVQIGNNDTLGSYGSGGLTNNGTLVFSRSDATLFVSGLNGSGLLVNNGSGIVTLSGVEPFTGSVVANAGVLALSGPNSNPSTLSAATSITINTNGNVTFNSDNVIGTTTPGVPVTINAGGTLTGLSTADGGQGTSSHLRGLLTLNGGTLAMAGAATLQTAHGSWDLDGGVTVPGTNTTSTISALSVIPSQTGGTIFNVTNGATSGVDLLVSGTLINGTSTAATGIIKNGPGVMVLDNNNNYTGGTTINGGVLRLGASGDSAPLATPLGAGTVTINTASTLSFVSSKGVTVTNAIVDDNSGTTVLISSGTNILTGVNTYSGKTIVSGGTILALQNSGSINSSATITVSNATFDVSTGGTVNNPSGSLWMTNSTFNLGTNFVTGLGSLAISNTTLTLPVSTTSPSLTVGTLATGGTTNLINLTSVQGQPFYPTNITIIKYASAISGLVNVNNKLTTLGLKLPTFGSPVGYLTNNVANSSVDFVLVSDTLQPIYPITWNGRTNGVNTGTWDIANTTNWVLTSNGTTPYSYQDTSVLLFDDTAAGTTNVNITTTVSPGSITFNNTNKTYFFSGTGKISGPGSLTNNGAGTVYLLETNGDNFSGGVTVNNGTLILSNANTAVSGGLTVNGGQLTDQHSGTVSGGLTVNGGTALLDQAGTFTGNTTINAGIVQVGNNDANGALPNGALTVNGALIFKRSDTALNVTTVIAGGGVVTNNGSGTVTLGVTETFTGSVVANAGTLVMNAGNAAAPDGISRASQLIINNGATVAVLTDNSLAGHGAAAGTLPILINAGGLLTGAAGADAGVGTSTHLPGIVTFNGGTLANSGTQAQTANGSWDIDDGVATAGGSVMSTITASNVVPTVLGGTPFDVPAGTTPNGIDLLVSGTLINGTAVHDAGINKIDTGTMALDNNNTFRGLNINGGTLQVGMAGDTSILTTPLGATTVTLNNAGSVLKFGSSSGATIGNVISDDGLADTLVLVAAGSNTLTAANTYTAPTVVSNGTLIVNGSLASSSVATLAKGMLGGNGTLGSGVTNSGTLTAGTVASIGALTCSSDLLNLAGSTNLMKLNPSTAPSNDVVTVGGNLTYAGTLKVLNLGGTYAVGETFKLFNVTGTISGAFSATNLPFIGGGLGLSWNPAAATLTVVQTVNTTPTNITTSVSGNVLTLSWPADHTGWRLQAQTNSLSTGLSNSGWADVVGATSVNSVNVTINPANGTVFYRMVYP